MAEGIRSADLKSVPLLRTYGEAELAPLARACRRLELPTGAFLFHEGEPVQALYVVRSGQLTVFRDAVGSPVQLLDRLTPGCLAGHVGLVVGGKHPASARTSELSELIEIPRQAFLAFLDEHPALRLELEAAATREYSALLAAAISIEKQREVRVRLHHPVEIELEDGRRRRAMLENLSVGGVCLHEAPKEWEEGAEVRFRLQLEAGPLRLAGRVAWRRGDSLGLAFTEMSAHHETIIQMAIHLLLDTPRH